MFRFINRRLSIVIVVIIFVVLFGFILMMEYQNTIDSQKEALNTRLDGLEAAVNRLLNERLYNLRGFIPYIQLNPDLTQEAFEEYAKLLLSEEDIIIKDIVLMQDTTVSHFYPVEGNEAIMGVDIAKVDIWNEKVLLAKKEGKTVIDGPYEIIEGGMGIICRIPFDYYPEADSPEYYGIMNYVVNYDVFLDQTGIKQALEDFHLRIEQVNEVDQSVLTIASNHEDFRDDAVTHILQLPNTLWKFSIEYKNGYNGFSSIFILISFLAFGTIVFSIFSLNMILKSREALEKSLIQLEQAQDQLILTEKLAALGGLTANVAHEINTPLGNCITLNSHIEYKHQEVLKKFESGKLSSKELKNLFDTTSQAYNQIQINLDKIVLLVDDFKRLRTSSRAAELTYIHLDQFIPDLLNDLKNMELQAIDLDCSIEKIKVVSDPVALRDILTNLFKNSVAHGFDKTSHNRIYVVVNKDVNTGEIVMKYWDSGPGFKKEEVEQVFTPFFSSKKHEGHTGLGLNVVHNAVVNVLGGHVKIVNDSDKKTYVQVRFKELNDLN